MSWRTEKNENGGKDLVWSGAEQGVAPSPHKGTANLQNVNIATESGEVMCSFPRVFNMQKAISGGTLNAHDATSVTYAGTTPLTIGAAITISGTGNNITGLSATTYWVVSISSSTIQLATTFNGAPISGLDTNIAHTSTFSTFVMGIPIGQALEKYYASGVTNYRYFILDSTGFVWCYDTNLVGSGYTWFVITASSVGSSTTSGISVLNGFLFVFTGTTIYASATVKLSDFGNTSFILGGQ